MSFGGLEGRGRKKQDPPIERDLYLSLEEVFHGCTKKMKISRRVSGIFFLNKYSFYFRKATSKTFGIASIWLLMIPVINYQFITYF